MRGGIIRYFPHAHVPRHACSASRILREDLRVNCRKCSTARSTTSEPYLMVSSLAPPHDQNGFDVYAY